MGPGGKTQLIMIEGKHFINWPILAYLVLQILKKKSLEWGPQCRLRLLSRHLEQDHLGEKEH